VSLRKLSNEAISLDLICADDGYPQGRCLSVGASGIVGGQHCVRSNVCTVISSNWAVLQVTDISQERAELSRVYIQCQRAPGVGSQIVEPADARCQQE
jgi:hypothetical protein